MHEHDGSGCMDCMCFASPMNTWPCMCPSNANGEMRNRTTNDDILVEQTRLWHPRFEMGSLGEMTKTQRGRHITFEVELDKQWEHLADTFDFMLFSAPRPTPSKLDEKFFDTLEDHIIRGEN